MCLLNDCEGKLCNPFMSGVSKKEVFMEKEADLVKNEPIDSNTDHFVDKSETIDNKDEQLVDKNEFIENKDEHLIESRKRPSVIGTCEQTNPKKKRRPAVLCIECPICKGPAPDHLHFGGQCCYSCRAFFRRTSHKSASSFRCRGGKNNCKIVSGTKSCIPCRLNKCLQIGMDPGQVRGKKCKDDQSTSGDDDSRYILSSPEPSSSSSLAESRLLLYSPPLCPGLGKTSSQESEAVLRFKAGILKYQGMCLQYQASLLEEQAGTASLLEEQAGTASLLEKQAGNASLLEEQAGTASLLDEQAGTASLLEKQAGTASLLELHSGTASLLGEQACTTSLFEKQSCTTSLLEEQTTTSGKTAVASDTKPNLHKPSITSFQEVISNSDETHFFNDVRNDFESNGYGAAATTQDSKAPYADPTTYKIIQYNPACYLEKRGSPGKIVENPNYTSLIPPRSTPSPLDLRSEGSKRLCPLPTGHEQMQNMPRIFFKTSVSCQNSQPVAGVLCQNNQSVGSVSCQNNQPVASVSYQNIQPTASVSCQNKKPIFSVSCQNNQPISGISYKTNQPSSSVSCQSNEPFL